MPRPAARLLDAHDGAGPIVRIIATWIARVEQRRRLATLSDRSLQDVGISRCDALREARKPFWRG